MALLLVAGIGAAAKVKFQRARIGHASIPLEESASCCRGHSRDEPGASEELRVIDDAIGQVEVLEQAIRAAADLQGPPSPTVIPMESESEGRGAVTGFQ